MKKVLLLVITVLMLIVDVEATTVSTNRLYFTSDNNRLYYDTKAFDENSFMVHHNMAPGQEYIDELVIENKTKDTYDLYLKLMIASSDELSQELIDNIFMEVYLDDEKIYAGTARGLDYQGNGVNLQESVLIGRYTPGAESKLVVKTKLSDAYTNIYNTSTGIISWEFYGKYGDEVSPILPDTRHEPSKYVAIISGTSYIFMFIILLAKRKKEEEEEEIEELKRMN